MSEEVKEREKFPVGTLTQPGGTMTSEGFIPHCLKDGALMPVALVFPKDRAADFVKSYADPHKHPVSGELMYVQPDGRHVTVRRMKRTPMKRTAWPRRAPPTFSGLEPKNFAAPAERASGAIKREPVRASMTPATGRAEAIPKEGAVRSEEYRRLVAALPCKNCGIVGYSQAAHLPPEGKGIKQDDRQIFPLCCTRVGITGCHVDYDQYQLFTRPIAMEVGLAWAADTRRQITAMGQWPANLERLGNE